MRVRVLEKSKVDSQKRMSHIRCERSYRFWHRCHCLHCLHQSGLRGCEDHLRNFSPSFLSLDKLCRIGKVSGFVFLFGQAIKVFAHLALTQFFGFRTPQSRRPRQLRRESHAGEVEETELKKIRGMKYVHQDSGGGRKIIKKHDVNKRPNITNQNFFVDAKAWVRRKSVTKVCKETPFGFGKKIFRGAGFASNATCRGFVGGL